MCNITGLTIKKLSDTDLVFLIQLSNDMFYYNTFGLHINKRNDSYIELQTVLNNERCKRGLQFFRLKNADLILEKLEQQKESAKSKAEKQDIIDTAKADYIAGKMLSYNAKQHKYMDIDAGISALLALV